jgi:uncharacterized protein
VKISGSTVLVTGATGGIGQAIVRALHERGAELVLTGRRTELLEPLAAELGARAVAADLGEAREIDRLLREAGEIDILVANAALPSSGPLESFSIEQIDRALDVNLRAPIVLARALLPAMLERGAGHLLFMSSLAGKAPNPGASIYNASKYGLRGFAAALRTDLHANGVGVSAIFPGFIRDAGMFADTNVKLPRGVGTRTPQDVADAVVDAIERNRGEVDVTTLPMRAGTVLASVAPDLAANVARRLGAEKISREVGARQRAKR